MGTCPTLTLFLPFSRTHLLCVRLSDPCSILQSKTRCCPADVHSRAGKEATGDLLVLPMDPMGQGRNCRSAGSKSAPPPVNQQRLASFSEPSLSPADLPENRGGAGATPPRFLAPHSPGMVASGDGGCRELGALLSCMCQSCSVLRCIIMYRRDVASF